MNSRACIAKPMNEKYSGCLAQDPDCPYAVGFGFSFHCEHPDHARLAGIADTPSRRKELSRRYRELRDLRRERFISELGMPIEECVMRIMSQLRLEPSSRPGKLRARRLTIQPDELL